MKNKNKLGKRLLAGVMSAAVMSVTASSQLFTQTALTASAANDNYAKLLQYSMYFYDANMCGSTVSGTSAIEWRGNCHTGDDVDGGFHDAGDHVMFGLPQGYAASTLGWGYYEFKDSYDSLGQTEHLKVITDYFCKFFRDSTKLNSSGQVENFCYQKGNGDTDHGYWGAPEKQGDRGKCYWTNNGASDIAAEYAAALALNYINFGNTEDLKYAKALYEFSVKYNSIATDGTTGFYNSDSLNDDQGWAAGWLYLATKDDYYKQQCAGKQAYIGWVHSWNNVYLGSAIVYAHITNDWSKVNGYLGGKCTGSNYLCMDAWGSARYNAAMQLCALAATKNSDADFTGWCKGQMNYLLGENPTNTCFVTGFADNSAKNTHHRAASGYQGYNDGMGENTTTYHPTKGHVLIGALAGGPADQGGTYSDRLNDYKCNEVAVDYNAGLVGAAAGLYETYKTGSLDTSITGVTKIYSGEVGPNPTEEPTQEPTSNPQQPTSAPTEAPTSTGTTDAQITSMGENKWEINVTGASKVIVTVNVSGDQNAEGTMGYSKGEWQQEDWKETADGNGNIVKEYAVPDGVSTMQFQVWWPNTVNSISAVLVKNNVQQDPTEPPTDKPTEAPTDAPTDEPTNAPTEENTQEEPKVTLYGDVNLSGEVEIGDVIMLCKCAMGAASMTKQQGLNADVNRDSNADATDASLILQRVVKLIDLPV